LTHFIWIYGLGKEHGPYRVNLTVYRSREQLRELLALIKSFGDQIDLVRMFEPPDVQLQDFLERPFQMRRMTEKAKNENSR
jgi:hypothetical protein